MTVEIPSGIDNGTYSLLWRTLSTVNGHTAQGYLPFTDRYPGGRAYRRAAGRQATASAVPEWALPAARWLALAWPGGGGGHLADVAVRGASVHLAGLGSSVRRLTRRVARLRGWRVRVRAGGEHHRA